MKSITTFCLFLWLSISLFSCKDHKTQEIKFNQADSVLIIQKSLQIILDKKVLPKEYYSQPLKVLVTNKDLNPNTEIKINGMKSILLPKDTNVDKLLKEMDIFKPIPLFEIIELKKNKGLIHIDIVLRATGLYYLITFKKNLNEEWEMFKISEGNI